MLKLFQPAACLAAAILLAGPAQLAIGSPMPTEAAQHLAAILTKACPVAGYDNASAYDLCAEALHKASLPFDAEIAWGGDQPDRPIRKRNLTRFNSHIFQRLYLPLFTFTGRTSVDEDRISHTPVIRVEAYFRNALPSGTYPYPFWHSAAKWSAYETANELRFYFGKNGKIFMVTRDSVGSEDRRGHFQHVTPPAFEGAWQWRDSDGTAEPHVSLLGSVYHRENPFLSKAEIAYRDLALRLRNETCLECHTPVNKAEAERLVLLQTPLHAAGEIDNVIKAVKSGEMPQDDIGLRKSIPPAHRNALLRAALTFKQRLKQADIWESAQNR